MLSTGGPESTQLQGKKLPETNTIKIHGKEAWWHIGMSSISCPGHHGGPGFKSQQGRVIFQHEFDCELTQPPYIWLIYEPQA